MRLRSATGVVRRAGDEGAGDLGLVDDPAALVEGAGVAQAPSSGRQHWFWPRLPIGAHPWVPASWQHCLASVQFAVRARQQVPLLQRPSPVQAVPSWLASGCRRDSRSTERVLYASTLVWTSTLCDDGAADLRRFR